MSSGYRLVEHIATLAIVALIAYFVLGVPVLLPLAFVRSKDLEEELERLRKEKKEHERKEQSHSRTIADLSQKVDNLEWQLRLAEPFIKKQLFNMETLRATVDLGVSSDEIGAQGGDYSIEREAARWMDMVVYSSIHTKKEDVNTVLVFVPLTEGLKERNILLSDLESLGDDTLLIKREEGNTIHFSEKCSTRLDEGKVSGKTFVLLLRVARFQEQRPIAIFENNMHFISLLKEEADKCPGRSALEVIYPSHIIEWVKGCAEATLVDSKSFNNDPLAFFLIKRALELTAEGKKVDVLDVVVNNRFIHQKRHEVLIEALSAYGHMG